MSPTYPTGPQKRIIWTALTGLSLAAIGGVIVLVAWLAGMLIKTIYPVLLPLGVAGVIAYILDPALEWLEGRFHLSRRMSLLILFVGVLIAAALFIFILAPPLLQDLYQFVTNLPKHIQRSRDGILSFLDAHQQLKAWTDAHLAPYVNALPTHLSNLITHLGTPAQHLFDWIGFAIGFLFVPIYVFYFLLEKQKIAQNWKKYLPINHSWWREEVVLVLSEINNYLILFFRGQVIVGLCIGVLTGIGLTLIGLPYALLIGFLAGALSLIPYLGIMSTLIPALLIGYSYAETPTEMWLKPLLVLCVFGAVQLCEGFFISPRIMGDRTGLHPMTVIVSILIWSLLLPGLLGPILAVPLTATLRVLMYRYVWQNVVSAEKTDAAH